MISPAEEVLVEGLSLRGKASGELRGLGRAGKALWDTRLGGGDYTEIPRSLC